MPITILLYEDDAVLRNHLESLFYSLRNEFCLLASFEDADEVMEHIASLNPDLIIMDIQMKNDEDGIYALYKIKLTHPHIKVMMLTTFDQDEKVFNAISLGAEGYMLKSDFSSFRAPQESMRKSLQVIMDGGAYLTPSVAKQILNLFTNNRIIEMLGNVKARFNDLFKNEASHKLKSAGLTRMQLTVLQEITDGKSTSEIAKELNLSENTINTHIKGIYSELEVHSRSRAIKKAIEKRLVRFSSP